MTSNSLVAGAQSSRPNQSLSIPPRATTMRCRRHRRPVRRAHDCSLGERHRPTACKPGDTLFSIARQFDTTVDDLKRLNRLSTDRIGIGDRLHPFRK